MIPIRVNGIIRHMAIEIMHVGEGMRPTWIAVIDGHSGAGGTWDAAVERAAKAADANGRLKEPT